MPTTYTLSRGHPCLFQCPLDGYIRWHVLCYCLCKRSGTAQLIGLHVVRTHLAPKIVCLTYIKSTGFTQKKKKIYLNSAFLKKHEFLIHCKSMKFWKNLLHPNFYFVKTQIFIQFQTTREVAS